MGSGGPLVRLLLPLLLQESMELLGPFRISAGRLLSRGLRTSWRPQVRLARRRGRPRRIWTRGKWSLFCDGSRPRRLHLPSSVHGLERAVVVRSLSAICVDMPVRRRSAQGGMTIHLLVGSRSGRGWPLRGCPSLGSSAAESLAFATLALAMPRRTGTAAAPSKCAKSRLAMFVLDHRAPGAAWCARHPHVAMR